MKEYIINKPFLLIVGETLYPREGTGDWIGFFKTENEALKEAEFQIGGTTSNKYWIKIVNIPEVSK